MRLQYCTNLMIFVASLIVHKAEIDNCFKKICLEYLANTNRIQMHQYYPDSYFSGESVIGNISYYSSFSRLWMNLSFLTTLTLFKRAGNALKVHLEGAIILSLHFFKFSLKLCCFQVEF